MSLKRSMSRLTKIFTTDISDLLFSKEKPQNYLSTAITLYLFSFLLKILNFYFLVDLFETSAFLCFLYGLFNLILKNIKLDARDIYVNQLPLRSDDKEVDPADTTFQVIQDKEEKLLKSYYNQVLQQSNLSFNFSLFFAAAGFVFILYQFVVASPESVGTENLVDMSNQSLYENVPSVIAFSIIEAVSALFFVQTNSARKTMIEFADKLRLDKKLTESLNMIETIEDKRIQSQVKALLVMNFSGLPMKYDDQDILKIILSEKTE